MLIVEYDGLEGHAFPDGVIVDKVRGVLKSYFDMKCPDEYKVTTSNGAFIDAVRLAVLEDKISHKEVKFKFKDELIDVDFMGNLREWPKGFSDAYEDILFRILEMGTAKDEARLKRKKEAGDGFIRTDGNTETPAGDS